MILITYRERLLKAYAPMAGAVTPVPFVDLTGAETQCRILTGFRFVLLLSIRLSNISYYLKRGDVNTNLPYTAWAAAALTSVSLLYHRFEDLSTSDARISRALSTSSGSA